MVQALVYILELLLDHGEVIRRLSYVIKLVQRVYYHELRLIWEMVVQLHHLSLWNGVLQLILVILVVDQPLEQVYQWISLRSLSLLVVRLVELVLHLRIAAGADPPVEA